MFCCEDELEALRHFATLTGIISPDEDFDMNIIESPLPAVHNMGINESTPPDAVHSYSYSSDLPICPETPRKKPRLMIDNEDDCVYGFDTEGGVPYFPFEGVPFFPFDGFDRVDFEGSPLISPRRLVFDTYTLDIDEPTLVPDVFPTLPNAIELETRQPVEGRQEREQDGPSGSRWDEEFGTRMT
jgi:hypothetical protein